LEFFGRVLPDNVLSSDPILALLIPGYAFHYYRRGLGNVGIAAYAVCAVIFFLFLGYPVANWAFAGLLSIHATSFVFLVRLINPGFRLLTRVFVSLGLILLLNLYIYAPFRNLLDKVVLPIRTRGDVIVVHRSPPLDIRRGEWIVYKIRGQRGYHGGVELVEGYGLSTALAGPGDRVTFSPAGYTVNGEVFPLEPYMPATGGFTVAKEQWFVWPSVAIWRNGVPQRPAERGITAALQANSLITQETFVGRPYKRWFWRKQVPAS
jgi:hypothetical protein